MAAFVGSLLVHLGLTLAFLHFSRPLSPRIESPPAAVEIEIQQSEAVRAAPGKPAKPAAKAAPSGASPSTATARGRSAPASKAAKVMAVPGPGTAGAGDVPARLDLTLHAALETASPGGATVRNLPGEIEPEVHKGLAKARIQSWIEEDSATRRVEKGLVDDWFAGLHKSLDRALAEHPPPASLAPSPVAALLRQYGDSAARYAATGNPSEPGRDSRTPAETSAERGPLAGILGEPHTFTLQTEGGANDLWAVIELSYDLEGKLRGSRVLDSSGSREFNLHVLNVVALGLPGVPALPDGGEGIHPDGTRSVWRVLGHVTFERDMRKLSLKDDAWYLPLATATSLLTGNFDETTGYVGFIDLRKPHLRCEVELLQVY